MSLEVDRRKQICFVGSALADIKKLDDTVKSRIGFQLRKVQEGLAPDNYKPMAIVGPGTLEIRVDDEDGNNIGRCFYDAKFKDSIYVLHAFVKKSRKTSRQDIVKGQQRYRVLLMELNRTKSK